MRIEDPSLSALGYQLLPLATSQLMGDSKEFDGLGTFWGFLLIVDGGGAYQHWRFITKCPWLPIVGPSNQVS